MRIKNIVHKGLRRLVEHDDASAVPAAVALKLRHGKDFGVVDRARLWAGIAQLYVYWAATRTGLYRST